MLQRMQSVWFLLAAVCAVLTIKFSFYSGNIIVPGQPVSFQYLTASFSIWILIVTIAITCIAAIDIFLYKNRKLQGRLAILGIVLSFLNIFLYLKEIHLFAENQGSHTITSRRTWYLQRSETRKEFGQAEMIILKRAPIVNNLNVTSRTR